MPSDYVQAPRRYPRRSEKVLREIHIAINFTMELQRLIHSDHAGLHWDCPDTLCVDLGHSIGGALSYLHEHGWTMQELAHPNTRQPNTGPVTGLLAKLCATKPTGGSAA